MSINPRNLIGAILLFCAICLILMLLGYSCTTTKPIPTPAPKFKVVKVVTIDKDGTSKTQFIKPIQ